MAFPEIPGLWYIPEFVSETEAAELWKAIYDVPVEAWNGSLKRRTLHYGFEYNYNRRTACEKIADLPEWQKVVQRRLETQTERTYDQVILNEYQPGQGISRHVDAPAAFGDTICSLSLGSTCTMRFAKDGEIKDLVLQPRSVVILTDDARYGWTHEIAARKSDYVNGVKTPRTVRVSLTYRFLKQK